MGFDSLFIVLNLIYKLLNILQTQGKYINTPQVAFQTLSDTHKGYCTEEDNNNNLAT